MFKNKKKCIELPNTKKKSKRRKRIDFLLVTVRFSLVTCSQFSF